MKITILKEEKNEYRVSLVPNDVKKLVEAKHHVFVQTDAGVSAGFPNHLYVEAGAKVMNNLNELLDKANFVFKLSKPTKAILKHLTQNQFLVSAFYLSNNPQVLKMLLTRNINSIGIEAINENGLYKVILPCEQVKGRFGALLGAYNLSKLSKDGIGKTFAPISHNNSRAQFTILNASYAGLEAARTILALGGNLSLLENDDNLIDQIKHDHALNALAKLNDAKFQIVKADFTDLTKHVQTTDVLINTNSVPGSITSKRITEKMISSMQKGSVYVDLGIDQGFGSDVQKKPQSFKKPTFVSHGVICFSVENTPTLFANSVSVSISAIITKYLIDIKGENTTNIVKENHVLLNAVLTANGQLTSKIVGESLHIDHKQALQVLK